MSELFEEEEDKSLIPDEEVVDGEEEDIISDNREQPISDARRRLEDLLEEKRLKKELEDIFDDL